MPSQFTNGVSRRRILQAGAGLALTAGLRALSRAADGFDYPFKAEPARAALTGEGRSETDVWAYNGMEPGPTLRVPQGRPVRIQVSNGLDQDTTVQWHGVRLPNAMDGVPCL